MRVTARETAAGICCCGEQSAFASPNTAPRVAARWHLRMHCAGGGRIGPSVWDGYQLSGWEAGSAEISVSVIFCISGEVVATAATPNVDVAIDFGCREGELSRQDRTNA